VHQKQAKSNSSAVGNNILYQIIDLFKRDPDK